MTDLIDVRVLVELAEDVGEPAARRFADRYREALGGRLEDIAGAAADGRTFATYELAANLAAASAMVGARPLARMAWDVACDALRPGTLPGTETLQSLERLARATEAALGRHRARTGDHR